MDQTIFYVLGIALVVSAVVLSVIGLRFEKFPPSRTALFAVLAYFVALVAATATFAVRESNAEKGDREAENAKISDELQSGGTTTSESTTSSSTSTSTTSTKPPAGGGSTIDISADPTGQLKFEQTSVTAKAGKDTIDFTNDSPVGHNVQIQDSSGKLLGGTKTITGSSATATVDLKPGKYTFFCSVPGHEAAGMKGTLTVK
jgi:plastocyanin